MNRQQRITHAIAVAITALLSLGAHGVQADHHGKARAATAAEAQMEARAAELTQRHAERAQEAAEDAMDEARQAAEHAREQAMTAREDAREEAMDAREEAPVAHADANAARANANADADANANAQATAMHARQDERQAIKAEYRANREPGHEGMDDDAKGKKPWWKFWDD